MIAYNGGKEIANFFLPRMVERLALSLVKWYDLGMKQALSYSPKGK